MAAWWFLQAAIASEAHVCRGQEQAADDVRRCSPYYNPHIQRPAFYPPSDGYRPPEDPLVGVARQIEATRELKAPHPRATS